jgi:polar amino acid transport system substrate-binding protein
MRRALLTIALLAGSGAALACSRPLQVPVATVGVSVYAVGERVEGAYPALLRELGAQQGCEFRFSLMPRARVEQMFENGQADLLVPATRSDRRDRLGDFVPLVQSRAVALGIAAGREPVQSLAELLGRSKLRVALVRGYDFGPAYRDAVERLREQGRLVMEQDPLGVARALQAGMAELTVLTPSILFGVLDAEPRLQGLRQRLRVEPLAELPWSEAGFYLSRQSLSEADRQRLRQMLEQARDGGAVWRALLEHYPAGSMDGALKPR